LVVGLVWLLWPSPQPVALRARQYLAFDACLLTDSNGLAGAQAAPVWAGMQDASLATRAKVSYLSVYGPDRPDNVVPFLAGLIQRHCDLIVAVGPSQVSAVVADAPTFSQSRFVVVGGDASGPNVTAVTDSAPELVRARMKALVTSAVQGTRSR
jgi:hypothetical protein